MWEAVKEAIQSNGRTLRFIAIIAVLVLAAWILSPH
jgi:predicted negative regulator of RcsB-dependent stress response